MCDHDDDIDIEDIAFAFGYIETQVEGEKDEDGPGYPSPADTLVTDLEYLDDEDKLLSPKRGVSIELPVFYQCFYLFLQAQWLNSLATRNMNIVKAP